MKKFSNKSFFETNDEKVNKYICTLLRWLVLTFPLIFFMSKLGAFSVNSINLLVMTAFGIAGTLLPSLFLHYKVNTKLQKYLNITSVLVTIFILSQETKFELRILFTLAVIISCFYSDPMLTTIVAAVGAVVMILSMLLNASEAADKTVDFFGDPLSWSKLRGGLLFFEYSVVSVVLVLFAGIRKRHLKNEQQLIQDLKEEKERYRVALEGSKDIIYEYDIQKDFIVLYGSVVKEDKAKIAPRIIGQFKSYIMKELNLNPKAAEKAIAFLMVKK